MQIDLFESDEEIRMRGTEGPALVYGPQPRWNIKQDPAIGKKQPDDDARLT
jgi:hypothetical protein